MRLIAGGRPRPHGGGIDAAARRFGGSREDWLDLSTGINPVPWPLPVLPDAVWTALPDAAARDALILAARAAWRVPEEAAVLAAPGASSLIARIPALAPPGSVRIPGPTYGEHADAFAAAGWRMTGASPERATGPGAAQDGAAGQPAAEDADEDTASASVVVHPDNPTGRWWQRTPDGRALVQTPGADGPAGGATATVRMAAPGSIAPGTAPLVIIDESFCDIDPDRSHVPDLATRPGTLILKSFGKFWGLAGVRLGFAIGDPALIHALAEMLGPWPVSGPALAIGAAALRDESWADETRRRLTADAGRLDAMVAAAGPVPVGGTTLFRLYRCPDAPALARHLAHARILVRSFDWDSDLLRFGLPGPDGWDRLAAALASPPGPAVPDRGPGPGTPGAEAHGSEASKSASHGTAKPGPGSASAAGHGD